MGEDIHIAFTNRLLDLLYQWVPLSASFRLALKTHIYLQKETTRSLLLDSSEHATKVWYSLDCFVVGYDYSRNGNHFISRIYMPNDIFTDLASFFQHKPAKLKLVVIQGQELLYVKKEDFHNLRLFPEAFDLVQHIMLMEQDLEAWKGWVMTLKDEQKVQEFNLRYPMYLLPNHICASFLQMTPSRFSAEKANYNRNN